MDGTYRRLAAAVLVAHQRDGAGGCLCGWSVLGASWADHVAQVLDAAGALRSQVGRIGQQGGCDEFGRVRYL